MSKPFSPSILSPRAPGQRSRDKSAALSNVRDAAERIQAKAAEAQQRRRDLLESITDQAMRESLEKK